MASGASASTHPHMAERGVIEILSGVAGFTGTGGGHVLRILDDIATCQTRATGMATRTFFGRTLKNTVRVTAFATRIAVNTA